MTSLKSIIFKIRKGVFLLKNYFNGLKILFYSGHKLVNDKSTDYFKKTILFGIDTNELLKKIFKREELIIGDIFIDSKKENLFVINLIKENCQIHKKSFEGINVVIINLKEDIEIKKKLNKIAISDIESELNYIGNMILYTTLMSFIQNSDFFSNKYLIHDKLKFIYESIITKKNKLFIYTVNDTINKGLCSYKINSIERLFITDFYEIHNLINDYGYSLLVKINSKKNIELSLLTDSLIVNRNILSFIGINEFGLPAVYQDKKESDTSELDGYGELHHYLDSYSIKKRDIYKEYLFMYIS